MKPMRVGEIQVHRLVELAEPFIPVGRMFPEATDEAVAPHRHWLEHPGRSARTAAG